MKLKKLITHKSIEFSEAEECNNIEGIHNIIIDDDLGLETIYTHICKFGSKEDEEGGQRKEERKRNEGRKRKAKVERKRKKERKRKEERKNNEGEGSTENKRQAK